MNKTFVSLAILATNDQSGEQTYRGQASLGKGQVALKGNL